MKNSNFATWFKHQLDRRQWNQSDFARRINLSPQIVSRWSRGERTPSPAYCDLIAEAFGVDLDLVLWQAGHRPNVQVIDPDDPRSVLTGLINRIDWTQSPDMFNVIEGMLHTIKNGQIKGKGE